MNQTAFPANRSLNIPRSSRPNFPSMQSSLSGKHMSIGYEAPKDPEIPTGAMSFINAIDLPDGYIGLADRPKNEDGYRMTLKGYTQPPLIEGFYSVEDFMMTTMGQVREIAQLREMIMHANRLNETLHAVAIIENDHTPDGKNYMFRCITPKVFDLKDLIPLLMERNFVRVSCQHAGGQEWLLFDKKNRAIQHISIYPYTAGGTEPIVTGMVSLELREKVLEIITKQLLPQDIIVTVSELSGYDSHHGSPVIRSKTFESDSKYAHAAFYPWIDVPLEEYFREYFESSANTLILMGDPGTGKSTLLRSMIKELNLAALTAHKTEVIQSPNFIPACEQFYEDTRRVMTGQHRVITVEDADSLMGRRSNGNSHMASILNATDGITSRKFKMIFSTNIKDIKDIDPALLRPGRCFDVLCFRNLSVDEVHAAREAAGLPVRFFDESVKVGTYSLAEALNDVKVQDQVQQIIKPRFGFIG